MAESEIIFAVEESPEGGYEARSLGYSIYTQAGTLEELKGMLQDAVRCHFDEEVRPRVIRLVAPHISQTAEGDDPTCGGNGRLTQKLEGFLMKC